MSLSTVWKKRSILDAIVANFLPGLLRILEVPDV